MISPEAMQILNAMVMAETEGNCNATGASGESHCLQYMPDSWVLYSQKYLGYVAELTEVNGLYVGYLAIIDFLERGLTPAQIALAWNAGEAARTCSRGINRHNVPFDSCAHVEKVLAYLTN
jgi:hypothetical protein